MTTHTAPTVDLEGVTCQRCLRALTFFNAQWDDPRWRRLDMDAQALMVVAVHVADDDGIFAEAEVLKVVRTTGLPRCLRDELLMRLPA